MISRTAIPKLFLPAAVLLFTASACGPSGPQGGPRVPTYPIVGQVLVDGQPAKTLLVKCNPVGESAVVTTISSFTDDEGRFSIGTYESGDGAPEGEYKLTFLWGQWGMNGRYGRPDKLKGRYLDAEKSEYTVTVKNGEQVDLGVIELTTK